MYLKEANAKADTKGFLDENHNTWRVLRVSSKVNFFSEMKAVEYVPSFTHGTSPRSPDFRSLQNRWFSALEPRYPLTSRAGHKGLGKSRRPTHACDELREKWAAREVPASKIRLHWALRRPSQFSYRKGSRSFPLKRAAMFPPHL